MIDTLKLVIDDFYINKSINGESDFKLKSHMNPIQNNIDIPDNAIIERPVLMKDCTGKNIYGDYLTLSSPLRQTCVVNICKNYSTGYPLLTISFSLPKFVTGSNFLLGTHSDLIIARQEMEKSFRDIGIFFNVDKSKLSRVDLTRNIETRVNVSAYISMLSKQIRQKRNREKYLNVQSYLIGNEQQELCIYDKIAELQSKCETIPEYIDENSNILRCELRWLKAKKIDSRTDSLLCSYSDLDKNYDSLKDFYKESVNEFLFKGARFEDDLTRKKNPSVIKIAEDLISSELVNKRNFVDKLFYACALCDSEMDLEESIKNCFEKILDIAREHYISKGFSDGGVRNAVSSLRKRLMQKQQEYRYLKARYSNSVYTDMELYKELYDSLIA